MALQHFDSSVAARAVSLGKESREPARRHLVSSDKLSAIKAAGTRHIYADTADYTEIDGLVESDAIYNEIDGNTINQPLVRKVIDRYLASPDTQSWVDRLGLHRERTKKDDLTVLLYTILCGRIGNDVVQHVSAGRRWEISIQLHMKLTGDMESSRQAARMLREMVPGAIVKVPFAPHQPNCFLLARALEQEGIPINFTSTFSARQALVAAMLANVTRTNIFMGRLNEGLHAGLLGEHVVLEAQRALARQRREIGAKTLLIAASLREWQTFERIAGCDVFTAPCPVIRKFLEQTEVAPHQIKTQLDTSYVNQLGVSKDIPKEIAERIPRLYEIEPEFVELLRKLRDRRLEQLHSGEELYADFERAGFGDFFYSPGQQEWSELRKSKLPNLQGNLVRKLPMDTLYSLLADADFDNHQDEMDEKITVRFALS